MKDKDGTLGPAFELRTAASKILLQKMTQEELNNLDEAAKDMGKKGYSEIHRRRSVIIQSRIRSRSRGRSWIRSWSGTFSG